MRYHSFTTQSLLCNIYIIISPLYLERNSTPKQRNWVDSCIWYRFQYSKQYPALQNVMKHSFPYNLRIQNMFC